MERPLPSATDRLRWRQIVIVALVLVILMIDGVDLQFLSIASPLVIAQWKVDTATFGIALSAALAGMALGAAAGGWLGDRVGRKPALLGSLVLFGVATGLSALATNVPELAALRFACGIGFGAATPNALALSTEWLPAGGRARAAALMSVGTPLGSVLASFMAAILLPSLGWRGCFAAFGVLTLAIGVAAIVFLPESASFLVRKGQPAKAGKLARNLLGTSDLAWLDTGAPVSGAKGLSGPAMRQFNIAVALCFGTASFVTYGLANWVPIILTGLGFDFAGASRGLFIYMLTALLGALASGRLIAMFGSRVVTLTALVLGLLLSAVFVGTALHSDGLPPSLHPLLYGLLAGFGITQGVVTGSLYAVVALGYPVEMRATGIGMALTLAKLGGVAAILSNGVLLAHAHNPAASLFGVIAAVLLGLGAGILLIDRHLPAARHAPATEHIS